MSIMRTTAATAAATLLLAGPALAQGDAAGDLPRSKLAIASVKSIDLKHNIATLPLFKSTSGGVTVWYVITDASSATEAKRLGVNFSPRLANLPRGCPTCTQAVSATPGAASVTFAGRPDFSRTRTL